MRFALFEDRLAGQFSPIALLRPVFELRCGHFTARERWIIATEEAGGSAESRIHNPASEIDWGVFVRPVLENVYAEEHPSAKVNDFDWLTREPTLLVNGRWIGNPLIFDGISTGQAAFAGEELVAILLGSEERLSGSVDAMASDMAELARKRERVDVGGTTVQYPWDLVKQNSAQLTLDFESRFRSGEPPRLDDRIALLGNPNDIHISSTAEIDPFVVIDARHGPVWIDEDVRVQAFTRLEGPCFIGANTQLFRANIREGCSIGPVCRVGGEIEESIFQGYGNKYHDGFVGHSYICPWVNLGALTTNSDLKNDYSSVRVPLAGRPIETGETKVGCFIGDHTKTALGSLFNTGASIGVMCLILPDGELLPKYVPSFTRIWHGVLEELPQGIESSLAAARTAMRRRQRELTRAAEALMRNVFEATAEERSRALDRRATR